MFFKVSKFFEKFFEDVLMFEVVLECDIELYIFVFFMFDYWVVFICEGLIVEV